MALPANHATPKVALAPSEPRKGPVMLRAPLIGHVGKQIGDTDDQDKSESQASDVSSEGEFSRGHRLIPFASRSPSSRRTPGRVSR
jgi:hypothetical protein